MADMRHLPFPDGTFAGVWCSASLLRLPKQDAPGTLAVMHRVLRPGGPLMLAVQAGAGEAWETWPDGTVERFFARHRPDEIAARLAEAGFTVNERHAEQATNRSWLRMLATRT
jgi:ubiquinone/menaquinone biosynthesis C-methylase UbiE